MYNIGLTGNRFSGKNSVAALFRSIGIPVFDADAVLKYMLHYKPELTKSVKKEFGPEYVVMDFINPIAFDTDDKFNKLLDLVEYELFQAYHKFSDKYQDSKQYTIFHSSIIFERSYQKHLNEIITVFAPKEDRMYRFKMETDDKLDVIHSLLSKEIPDLDKNKLSDYIIHNYEGAPDALMQVNNIDTEITDKIINFLKVKV